jgi:hypothetical protein
VKEDYLQLQTRKGLLKLREQLLNASSLIRESNSICREMNELLRFSITLRIPAKNLTPIRKVMIPFLLIELYFFE